jgi:MFS superfamily sulfate permease-like transporter
VVTLRVDQSLYFANARYLEQKVLEVVADNPSLKHVILMCSAVNEVDGSAMEVLEAVNHHLSALGIGFHLSEVKGPVMATFHVKAAAQWQDLSHPVSGLCCAGLSLTRIFRSTVRRDSDGR